MRYESINNQIQITNNCGEDIYILVVPFEQWNWGERGFIGSKNLSSGMKTDLVVNCLTRLSSTILEVNSILTDQYLSTIDSLEYPTELIEEAKILHGKIISFLEKDAIKIPSGDFKKLQCNKNTNSLRTLSLSGWGSLFGVQDVTLFIVTKNLTRQATFRTNFDWSWVVEPNEIVRSKNESIWHSDKENGVIDFQSFCKNL